MGFIDFFKRLTEAKQQAQEPRVKETIEFHELENWLKVKEKKIKNKEKQTLDLIKEKIIFALEDLNKKVNTLENFDLNSRKDKEKIKAIVKENLNNYLYHIKRFIYNLQNLNEENFERFIMKTNAIFVDFDKRSYINYQKATFLIGKEMAATKESTKELSKYLKKAFDEHKKIIDDSKTFEEIKSEFKQLTETKKNLEILESRIKKIEKRIEAIKEKNEKLLIDIEKIKKTTDYIENSKKKQEIKQLEQELGEEVLKLKSMIDFKALSNIFHISEKEMKIIKAHKEDFKNLFQKDNGSEIDRLLNESKLSNEKTSGQLEHIKAKKQKQSEIEKTIKKDQAEKLLLEVNEAKLELLRLEDEKQKELKSHEKLKIKKQQSKDPIKQKLDRFNLVVSDN